ncbi:uncharacterized protein LTHEOB_9938 [Neofusicoccum parvum]|uniref:Uncharacterized protein LTHEOB_9938 n=1 Tax=Neofusicoccum parvum TaxID=310453 RepID=A0ACB5S8S3_9PEZI|nr:uncharacterized protein LTHEOB_9938 [Neofusicoccum parvum]
MQSSRPQSTDVAERLAVVSNALHCFSLALPEPLRYRNEYLDFETAEARKLHSAKFSIHVMRQLATLMTYRSTTSNDNDPDHQGHRRFIEASDNVFAIVKNSAEDHVRHVNPFLASTVWFAAAVQLAHRFGAAPGSNTDLVESKFELLRMNCQQYAKFWATPDALLENLSALEAHLAAQRGAARPSPSNENWASEGQLCSTPLRSYSYSTVPMSGNHYPTEDGDQNGLASFTADDDALTGLNLDTDFGLEPSGMSFGLDGLHFDGHAP